MSEQYFSAAPASQDARRMLHVTLRGFEAAMETSNGVFSGSRLDLGTSVLLRHAPELPEHGTFLDLGCGWGLAGVYAALVCGAENVVMTDIDPRAAALARRNARKNGAEGVRVYTGDALEAVPDRAFDRILLNPPYQTDFAVAKRLILKSFNRLEIGGKLFMVTKRRTWYFNKLKSVFGGAHVREADGYFVFEAERRARQYAQK